MTNILTQAALEVHRRWGRSHPFDVADPMEAERFRAACRAELGDRSWPQIGGTLLSVAFFAAILLVR